MKNQMSAVYYRNPGEVEIRKVGIPVPQEDEALLKIIYSGICGSDIHVFRGIHLRNRPGTILCHEFVGEIVKAPPSNVQKFLKGSRVVVEPTLSCGSCDPCKKGRYNICSSRGIYGIDKDGSLAEYMAVPISKLYLLPDEVDSVQAAFIEPLAAALHAVKLARLKDNSKVLVFGGGPIGALIALVCKTYGVGMVVVSEINPYRLKLIEGMQVETVNPEDQSLHDFLLNRTANGGVDIIFDAAGSQDTFTEAISLASPGGRIIVVSNPSKPITLDMLSVSNKELEIVGSRIYLAQDFKDAIKLIAQGGIDPTPLISRIFQIEESTAAFDFASKDQNVMKVLIKS